MRWRSVEGVAHRSVVAVVMAVVVVEGVVEDVVVVSAMLLRRRRTRVGEILLSPSLAPLFVVVEMNFPSLSSC